MKLNSNNFYTVQGWMVKDLHLKGIEKDLYAIIYGFSQDEESKFYGSIDYLCQWTGASESSVHRGLKSLEDKKLIIKTNRIGETSMYSIVPNPCQNDICGGVKMTPNNIVDNKPIRKNLYNRCLDEIENNFTDADIKKALEDFLSVRITRGCLSTKSWVTIITELNSIAETKKDALEIVKNATAKGYMKLYPVPKYNNYSNKYHDNVQELPKTEEDTLMDRYREEFASVLPMDRPSFEEWSKNK